MPIRQGSGRCAAEECQREPASRGFEPAWALIHAGNLAAFPVLPGLSALTIIADHDRVNSKSGKRAGLEAARTLAQRYVAAGFDPERSVRIWTAPAEGRDFADLAAAPLAP